MKERFASLRRKKSDLQAAADDQVRIIKACQQSPSQVLENLNASEDGYSSKQASALLKRCMEEVITLNVPLQADVHQGANWSEAK